jgi:hypothetical protein
MLNVNAGHLTAGVAVPANVQLFGIEVHVRFQARLLAGVINITDYIPGVAFIECFGHIVAAYFGKYALRAQEEMFGALVLSNHRVWIGINGEVAING